jgi:hypothetical protein
MNHTSLDLKTTVVSLKVDGFLDYAHRSIHRGIENCQFFNLAKIKPLASTVGNDKRQAKKH